MRFNVSTLVLAAAVSLDVLCASAAIAVSGTRIPMVSKFLIAFLCALACALPACLGGGLLWLIPQNFAAYLGVFLLFVIGAVKFLGSLEIFTNRKEAKAARRAEPQGRIGKDLIKVYKDPSLADLDASKTLSAFEAVILALTLSIDGFAAGFSLSLSGGSAALLFIYCGLAGFAAVSAGAYAGNALASRSRVNLSALSGLALMAIAAAKLFMS